MKRILLASLIGFMSGSLLAAEPEWNAPNEDKTAALAHRGDPIAGKVAYEICRGCHGADARGRSDALYPQLAGQHATVLIKQMVDVRLGHRDDPKMEPFVSKDALTPVEISDIASYLALLPTPVTNGKGDGADLVRGERLYRQDCQVCHGKYGEGDAEKFYPVVASQHYEYLNRELVLIRDGRRQNAYPEMIKVVKNYSDDEIRAVSDFMSRLVLPANR